MNLVKSRDSKFSHVFKSVEEKPLNVNVNVLSKVTQTSLSCTEINSYNGFKVS